MQGNQPPPAVLYASRLRATLATILTLLLLHPAQAEDRRLDKSQLTVANFNVEFMWDGIAPEEGNERIDFPHRGNPALAAEKMRKIAVILRQLDADVVTLDEVENLDALTLLNDEHLQGMGYQPYLKDGRDTYTGQDVGLLTRIDPDEPLWRNDNKGTSGETTKSASKNYTAKLTVNGERIALVAVHFLSRPTDTRRLDDRQAQADAIADAAEELDAEGFHVIVLGDINDYDGSPEASDHESNQPITNVLARLRGMDPADPDDDLVNVASFIPKNRRFTCHWDKNDNGRIDGTGELTSIDHILLAPELARRVTSAAIANAYDPAGISDHFPLLVTFETSAPDAP